MPIENNLLSFSCPHCHQTFQLFAQGKKVQYCPFCAAFLKNSASSSEQIDAINSLPLLSNRYKLLASIGKGGMGEVYLALDTHCGRQIALKQIRADLLEHPHIRKRFLKEAHITCQLMHPAIIPIYSIQTIQKNIYYTMPFVEGENLKQIIRKTRQQEKKGLPLDHIGGSIPALMRIFMTICQAIAYAHTKGVLHRDLKPENIIIGKYGEVLILDWGLAKLFQNTVSDEEEKLYADAIASPNKNEITRFGKVVGTIAYMAPERALGQQATMQTDIYALGAILYQLLTLKNPFHRGTLEEFRKNIAKEELIDPVIAAPYRDVPKILAQIAIKCLHSSSQERYGSVDLLIHDLENYLEGRSDWFHAAELNVYQRSDWEFQENVLIAEHIAITHATEETEWVNLMISKQSFSGNMYIATSICIKDSGHGIGILLSIPEADERKTITDGYCLWIGSDQHRSTKLLRSGVEVIHAPDIFLKRDQWTRIRIEKIDKSIHLYFDEVLQLSYIAHLPLIGTHIGVLSRDAEFEIKPLQAYVGSLNLTVNCLAVPDAFLAHRDFTQALSEYRRIAYSFPDRVEGREAIFRAGLTFIEQAKNASSEKESLLDQALNEFEKLHGSPSAPLEYLGKALVYQLLDENEEEIKCFEMAYRRYPHHPLLPLLQEQILSRMHEVSRLNRLATYRFVLLASRHLSSSSLDTHTRRLFNSLQKYWEVLPFIEEQPHKFSLYHLTCLVSFWLAKPHILGELIEEMAKLGSPPISEIVNALMCLIHLGANNFAQEKFQLLHSLKVNLGDYFDDIELMLTTHTLPLDTIFNKLFSISYHKLNANKARIVFYIMDLALDAKRMDLIYFAMQNLEHCQLNFDIRLQLNIKHIWALLYDKNWPAAYEILYAYPIELLNKESSYLHFLYGCWLEATEGRDIAHIHFSGLLDHLYPRSWTLAGHTIKAHFPEIGGLKNAFLWEKRQLYRQLSLYYFCAENEQASKQCFSLYKELLSSRNL